MHRATASSPDRSSSSAMSRVVDRTLDDSPASTSRSADSVVPHTWMDSTSGSASTTLMWPPAWPCAGDHTYLEGATIAIVHLEYSLSRRGLGNRHGAAFGGRLHSSLDDVQDVDRVVDTTLDERAAMALRSSPSIPQRWIASTASSTSRVLMCIAACG